MLQYCVLYAKIQKLNMSNIMNKTNSDNEVYEESDLPTRPGAGGQGPPCRCSCLGLDCSELRSTKEKLQPPPLRQWQKESPQWQLVKLETNVTFRALRRAHEARHCSDLLRCGNKHQRQEASAPALPQIIPCITIAGFMGLLRQALLHGAVGRKESPWAWSRGVLAPP